MVRDISNNNYFYFSFRSKEFPVALKKIGSYVGKIKSIFSNFQREVSSVTDEIDVERDITKENNVKKEDKTND